MLFQVLAIGRERIVFRKETGCHGVLSNAAEIRRHFFLRRRPGLAFLATHKGQRIQADRGRRRIFQGELLTGQLFPAVHEKGDSRQGIAPRLVFENPFDGDMGNGIVQLQCFLNLALSHGLARQDGLDQGLDEDGLAGAVFQEQDAIIAIKAEGRVDIAFVAVVIDDIGETDSTDGGHGDYILSAVLSHT